ncbi:hypothetical protein G7074_14405 [Pedobacter sp. HDW13]|nr:S41 family peptidase [Pedobacter sp. HDW13]QIL40346.1 hypothetical protein G7074_14405 [Pedobacter sp. HDW13]
MTVALGCGGNASHKQNNRPTAEADTTAKNLLTVNHMHGDLAVLWGAIKELHPGYGFYTPATQLKQAYQNVYNSLKRPLSESEFIDAVYPFLCQLRCGHTQLKHAASFKPSGDKKVPHLPFHVLVQQHRVWITGHQVQELHAGDEIITMNGIPVSEMIDHGFNLYCGDGYNETFKELFLSEYDGFEDVCNKYFHWQPPYTLNLRTAKGGLKTVKLIANDAKIPAETQKTVDNFAGWTVAGEIENSRLRFQKNKSTAWFQVSPFAYTDTVVYEKAFALIKRKDIRNLVLDLRHNTGGDIRVAIRLLSYLADADYNIVADVKSRFADPASSQFARYFDAGITSGFKLGFKAGAKAGNWHHITVTPEFGQLYGPFKLAKTNHFDGNLIVLIDGATFSSGALFTAALKAQNKNVKFIGRETAGSEEGCNGMTVQRLTLPNSKIVVDFPWMRVVSVAKNASRGRGIMPNYTVNYSPADVLSNKDLDLNKALALLR